MGGLRTRRIRRIGLPRTVRCGCRVAADESDRLGRCLLAVRARDLGGIVRLVVGRPSGLCFHGLFVETCFMGRLWQPWRRCTILPGIVRSFVLGRHTSFPLEHKSRRHSISLVRLPNLNVSSLLRGAPAAATRLTFMPEQTEQDSPSERTARERRRLHLKSAVGVVIGVVAGLLFRNVWIGCIIGLAAAVVMWSTDRGPGED